MVVNGNFDGKKNRLTRREKKASFADALADDKAFKDRADKYIAGEKAKRQRPKHKRSAQYCCLLSYTIPVKANLLCLTARTLAA